MPSPTTFPDDKTRQTFRTLAAVFSKLRDLDSDMPISMISVLSWVALNEGKTQREMIDALGMPSSTSSRNLAALSKVHRLGKPGLDLIEWHENPEDRRAKLLYLTSKGRLLVRELTARL